MVRPVSQQEKSRLQALENSGLMHSGRSPEFDTIVNLASRITGCPIALISLVGEDEQWFKAKRGLDADGTPRDVAFCNYAIQSHEPLVISDARKDERFKDNPLVCGKPHVVFYAGFPLSIDGENNLGTLCVIDKKPRTLLENHIDQLRDLALTTQHLIATFKEQNKAKEAEREIKRQNKRFVRTTNLLEQVKKMSGVGGWELLMDPPTLNWTDETKRIHDLPLDYEPTLEEAINFYAPEARPIITKAVEHAMATGEGWDLELPLITAKGRNIWVHAIGNPTLENGRVIGAIGAFQDITERRLAETRIRHSEKEAQERSRELRAVLENMGEGVSVFDSQAKITVWNQNYIDLFGKDLDEVSEGVSFRELLENEKSRGEFDGDIDVHMLRLTDQLKKKGSATFQFQTRSGTIIRSMHAPLPNGGWVGTHSDVTAQVEAAKRDEHASRHDPLTGLANRLAFNTRLEKFAKDRNEDPRAIVLLLIDLDNFKEVNDTYGHQIGDDLLVAATQCLKSCVRQNDLVARLGGDEFAVVIECERGKEGCLAEALSHEISARMKQPFDLAGVRLEISASIGISAAPSIELKVDDLMNRADYALYKVKERARGGYQFYNMNLHNEARRKQRTHKAVRTAIQDNNLRVSFQPFYELDTMRQAGAEALIRWRSSMDRLRASELVRIAEETGAIEEIGGWILEHSIRNASQWNNDLQLAVNVSPSQLGNGHLLRRIVCLLREWNFPAQRLELEITENTLLKEDASVLDELNKIRSLGSKIVLDDFGTGYASLSYLQRFKFDKLKVDRSFVVADVKDTQSQAVVSSIVTLAKKLGMETTAEGIEGNDRLHQVATTGCTYGQGFFLAKPVYGENFKPTKAPFRSVA